MVIVSILFIKQMNKPLVLLCVFFSIVPVFAQSSSLSNIKSQLDAMFSGLDKTKISTGYLWDNGVNLIEAEYYNGRALTDSNYVTLPLLGDILQSINSASVGADTICVQAALSRIQRLSSSNNMMVGVLFRHYNYIVENAITDNLIRYTNGVVADTCKNGVWQNPYGTEALFAYAMGNDGIVSQSVTYTFADVDSLLTLPFSSIQFDPGDGAGYRDLSPNGTFTLTYQECGSKDTMLKMTAGGQVYLGHCRVNVIESIELDGQTVAPDVDTLTFSATYGGESYWARVVYGKSVSFNKRPLIVSEGFDPWRLFNDKKTHDYSGSTDLTDIPSELISNYDVFYIDWYDYGADIRANAEVLKSVIEWVNENNHSGEPNIILGQSMGGLIARYALRDMELNNELHNTTLFISHDVPHLGANVSPGLQYLYWDIRQVSEYVLPVIDLIRSLFRDSNLSEFNNLGNYKSVKQMLSLYIDSTWNYNSSEFDYLMGDQSEIGFPEGDEGASIENVAIVNGGNFDSSSWYVDGNKLFHAQNQFSFATLSVFYYYFRALFKKDISSLIEQTPGISTLDFQWSVYPYLSNNSTMYSVSLTLKKRYRWRQPRTFVLYSKERNTPTSGIPFDLVSSSYFFVHNNPMIVDWTLPDYFSLRLGFAKKIPFIPTASAMVMPNDFGRDFLMNKPKARVDTPFDSFVLPDTSTFHTSFYTKATAFLNEVVETTISGPSIGVTGTEYSITGPNSSSFSFSTSSPGIATIDSLSNSLTVNNTGFVDVIAEDRTGNHVITKRKRIFAGLPQMVLNHTSVPSGYEITASYVSAAVEDFLNSTGMKDSLQFKWQLNTGDNIQTVIDTSRVFTAVVDSLVSFASITFSVLYHGHESPKSSIILRNPSIYSYNVHSIRRFCIGTRYYSNLLESYSTCPSFKIWIETPFGYMVPNVYSGQFEKLKVLGKTIEGDYVQFNNIPCVEYDLFLDSDVAAFISSVTESDPIKTLYVYICDYEERVKQVVQIPIIWRAPL